MNSLSYFVDLTVHAEDKKDSVEIMNNPNKEMEVKHLGNISFCLGTVFFFLKGEYLFNQTQKLIDLIKSADVAYRQRNQRKSKDPVEIGYLNKGRNQNKLAGMSRSCRKATIHCNCE